MVGCAFHNCIRMAFPFPDAESWARGVVLLNTAIFLCRGQIGRSAPRRF